MSSDTFNISFIKYDPKLGDKLGRGASLFLSALQFLLNNQSAGVEREGRKWIYNSADQWAEYLGYSSRQIERIVASLSKQGLILIQKLNQFKANRTNYYTIDEEKLDLLLQSLSLEKGIDETISISSNKETFDKKSECFRPQGGFISKKTNKEIIVNKSEEKGREQVRESLYQVQQVKNIKLNNLKNETEKHLIPIKMPIAQEMLSIWNKILENAPAIMTKQLAPFLVAAYKNKFHSDLKQWQNYCRMIASSPYLTGKDFKLSLLWTLKYTTIERIKNLELGVKEIELVSYSQRDAVTHIQNLKEAQRCKDIRFKILTLFGEHTYKNWFSRTSLQIIDNKICFQAENRFMQDYIIKNYGHIFEKN